MGQLEYLGFHTDVRVLELQSVAKDLETEGVYRRSIFLFEDITWLVRPVSPTFNSI